MFAHESIELVDKQITYVEDQIRKLETKLYTREQVLRVTNILSLTMIDEKTFNI